MPSAFLYHVVESSAQGFLGFVLGECFERNLTIEKTILYSAGSVIASLVFILFVYSQSHGGMVNLLSEYVGTNLKLTLALYEEMDMPEENIVLISNSLDSIQYVLSAFYQPRISLNVNKPFEADC